MTDDNQETATWASLIAIGGAVCIAIIIIVAVLLKRIAHYRKQARHYDELHRYKYNSKVNSVQQFSINLALHRYAKLTCHMGSHSVTCHPTEVRIPPLPPAEAGTRFGDPTPEGCKAELTYVT